MRKFATKFISRQNSVNQYFVFCLAYFVFCLAYLVFWLKNLVFVWCTWCLVYVVFCLAYIIYFWRTWCIFWRNWCLWHWDVVFLTFLNWDGASNIFITKNVQIYVFIPWINFPKSSSYRVLCGKRYASLKKVHHPRLWGLWQLSGVLSGFILIKFLFLSMQMQRCELRWEQLLRGSVRWPTDTLTDARTQKKSLSKLEADAKVMPCSFRLKS